MLNYFITKEDWFQHFCFWKVFFIVKYCVCVCYKYWLWAYYLFPKNFKKFVFYLRTKKLHLNVSLHLTFLVQFIYFFEIANGYSEWVTSLWNIIAIITNNTNPIATGKIKKLHAIGFNESNISNGFAPAGDVLFLSIS